MYPRTFRLNNNVKNCVALILKYYRKQLKMKQRDFITYNDALICSMDSYSRIENLHPIKSDSIYIYLLHQINATIEFDPEFWRNFHPLFEQLLENVTFYHIDQIKKTTIKIKKVLPEESKDIFVQEIIELMNVIPTYYENCSELSEEQFDKYYHLYPIFTKPLKLIIQDMLFTYTVHRTRSAKKEQEIFQYLQIAKDTHPMSILNRSYMYYYQTRYLDCFIDSLYLEQYFLETKNYNRLLDVYDVLSLLYVEIQHDQYNIYKEKLFQLVEDHKNDLHHNKYLQNLYQCGILYVQNKDYTKAFTYLCEVADQDDYHYLPAALIAHTLCTLTDIKPTQAILKDVAYPHRFPQRILDFYEYYRMKYQGTSSQELESYLMEKVLPHVKKDDELYYTPFCKELDSCLKVTRHYGVKRKFKASV